MFDGAHVRYSIFVLWWLLWYMDTRLGERLGVISGGGLVGVTIDHRFGGA